MNSTTTIPDLSNPFPGLRCFLAEEDYLFFGRHQQIEDLLRRLRTNRLVAVVGTSGSGKSSLVRAGLLPAVLGGGMAHAGSAWEIAVMRPGGSPLAHLARALCETGLYDADAEDALFHLLATLSRSRNGLIEAVRQSKAAVGSKLLLVVDQFEELFRFQRASATSQEEAIGFVNLLLHATQQQDQNVYVVLTMRSDFLGDCSQFLGLAEAVNDGEFLIPRMTRDQIQEAIEGPILVRGAAIATRLLFRLLNDVQDTQDQLPVLQHALMRTWDHWQRSQPNAEAIGRAVLDLEHYEATGGMQEALSLHADEIFDAFPSDRHRTATARIFKALTERGPDGRGIRRPTRLGQLTAIAAVDEGIVLQVIDAFRMPGVTFLMPPVSSDLDDTTVIDISHESLMRVWCRLRGWAEEESQSARIYRRLHETAELHAENRAGLYHDPDLQIARSWRDVSAPNTAWANQYGGGFDQAMVFLDTSRAAAECGEREREAARQQEIQRARQLTEAQARVARLFMRFVAGLAVGVCLTLALAFWALLLWQEATRQAEDAKLQEDAAETAHQQAQEHREQAKALGLVQRILNVSTSKVPAIINEMTEHRPGSDPLLRKAYNESTDQSSRKLHASLALLPVDPSQVEYLYVRLLEADPQEGLPVICDALAPYKEELLDKLRAVAEKPEKGKESQRLRAVAALAKYDPRNERWLIPAGVQEAVASDLLADHLTPWKDTLRPVAGNLVAPLSMAFRSSNRPPEQRLLAADILADYYAADQPQRLVDLLMDADEKQFGRIFSKFKERSPQSLPLLIAEIDKKLPAELLSSNEQREKLAKRQVNTALALLRMNKPEKVWPLLRHSRDPRVRTYLIHRLSPAGVDPSAIVTQLDRESDPSILQALMLSLGEFGEKVAPEERQRLLPQLQKTYLTAADPGLHAATEWLLRKWQQEGWLQVTNKDWSQDKQQQVKLEEIQHELVKETTRDERRWYVNGQGQTMVVIPGPMEFWMGSPPEEEGRVGGPKGKEEFRHWQRIGRSFAIASKEVTLEQFLRFRKDHPYDKRAAPSSDCPVNSVSWYDAAAYCNWLSEQEGIPREEWCYEPNPEGKYAQGMTMAPHYLQPKLKGYRLPTEAEWEYACRAGSAQRFSFGVSEELLPKYAWFNANSDNKSWPVGSLKPNDFGLFDMYGNEWEWCQDGRKLYGEGADGKALEDMEDSLAINTITWRIMRGSSIYWPGNSRSALRGGSATGNRFYDFGFRPARTLSFSTFDRYAAARAAAGQDKNKLDDAEKAKLCRRALDLLKAELADWNKVHPPRLFLVRNLWHWQQDSNLARLLPKEHQEFTKFWADVAKTAEPATSAERLEFARVAVRIAAGLSKEEPPLDEAARENLRAQAFNWLMTELTVSRDRVAKANLIATAALLGWLEKLVEAAPEDGLFQAELALYYVGQEKIAQANAARSKARPLLEKQLVKEPENRILAAELADLMLMDSQWTVLQPTEIKSQRGATMTLQKDGSILASGTNGQGDVYIVQALSNVDRIAALRLEALPDPSLPNKGPGRHASGNFQLSAFRPSIAATNGGSANTALALESATASFDYKWADADIAGLVDEKLKKVWHVWGRFGEAHQAVFVLKKPLEASRGRRIVIELRHKDLGVAVNLGRFRISVIENLAREQQAFAAMAVTDPWLKLAVAYALAGQNDEAVHYFSKSLNSADGYDARKAITEQLVSFDRILEALVKRYPAEPQLQLALARNLAARGKTALAAGQPADALALLKQAQDLCTRLLSLPNAWTVLTPVEMKTETGAKMELQKDGSIFVPEPAGNDTCTLVFQTELKGIKGLRLEALADARLPHGGPGWTPSDGNFVLSKLSLQTASFRSPEQPTSIALRNAWADFSQRGWNIGGILDGKVSKGWAVSPEFNKDHTAVFETAVEVGDGQPTRLTVRLDQHGPHQDNLLGRFRLSFTTDAAVLHATRLRLDLKESELLDLYAALGTAYAQQGQSNEAVATFKQALVQFKDVNDDRLSELRIHAARIAALAAAGQGKDKPPLDDAAKGKLRGQALDWLKAELNLWSKRFDAGPPRDRPIIVAKLSDWYQDRDLAGVRDAAALAKLPADEQKEWRTLWARVPEVTSVVPTSREEGQKFRYTTNRPAEGWQKAEFDDKAWQEGLGGFGTNGKPGAVVRTEWRTADIWLRRECTMPAGKWDDLLLLVHHDDDAEVYINGVLALKGPALINFYEEMPLSAEARRTLKPGKNVFAIHCHNASGPQYIDVGIVAVKSNAGRLALARIAFDRKRYALATELSAAALASDPTIADDRLAQHRARVALLAAAGQARDELPPDEAAKATLRGQALDWLKAELSWLRKELDRDRTGKRAAVEATLLDWQKDGFLADIRDTAVLANLPADEQKACTDLWADVAALLREAEGDANNAFHLPGVGRPNSWMAQDRQGRWLAIPTADKVAIFDARTGELVRTLAGHTGRVYAIAFSPDGKSLAGGNGAGAGKVSTVKFWNLKTGAMTGTLDSLVGEPYGVAFSKDGKSCFAAGPGGVQMWDLTSGRSVRTFKTTGGVGHGVIGLSPDGKRVVCNDTPTTVKVWQIEGDNPPVTLGGHTNDPHCVMYSPDGKLLATGSDAELLLWDGGTLKRVKKIATPASWLTFSPDGKSLFTAQHHPSRPLQADVVTRWDLATYEGMPLPPLTGRTGWPVYHLSPDGKRLYSQVCDGPDAEGRIRVYNAATGADVEPFSLQAVEKRLSALLRGEDKPADNAERLDFAQVAYEQKKFALAARLWAEALANDPMLPDDPLAQHRTHAAHAAALAAAGQGKDEPPLDGAEKTKLRGQALDWLKAELTVWREEQPRLAIMQAMCQWQEESDLAGIRDKTALDTLLAEEKIAWTHFWAEVAKAAQPADNAERLYLAQSAFDQKQFGIATRLWAEALGNNRKLAAVPEFLTQASPANPKIAAGDWLVLALAHMRLKETDQARKACVNAATLLKPTDAPLRPLLREVLLAVGTNSPEATALLIAAAGEPPAALNESIRLNPKNAEGYRHRGEWLAERGRWKDASSDLAEAFRLEPDTFRGMHLGILLLHTGEIDSYRAHCQAMLARWAATKDNGEADTTLKTILLLPDFKADAKQLDRLAEVAVSGDKKVDWFEWYLLARGLYDYRTSKYADALAACRESRRRAPQTKGSPQALAATNLAIEAMALHRSGDETGALRAMAEAKSLVEIHVPGIDGDWWADFLVAHILYREAERLILNK